MRFTLKRCDICKLAWTVHVGFWGIFYGSLLCLITDILVMVSGEKVSLPSFNPRPTNVSYYRGDIAVLFCSIENLNRHTVAWRKAPRPTPLTIGTMTYVDDPRITVNNVAYKNEWNLVIRKVRLSDAGKYECQITVRKKKKFRHYVYLQVLDADRQKDSILQGMTDQTDYKANGPEIFISGTKFVEKGGNIHLTCNATGAEFPPDEIDWFKDGDKITTDITGGVYISKTYSLSEKTIVSVLEIKRVSMNDAGTYVCRTSDLQIIATKVNVLNAETVNVKRGMDRTFSNRELERKSKESSASRLYVSLLYICLWTILLLPP